MPAGPRCVVAIAAQKESISGEGTLFLLCFAVGGEWRKRKARMGGSRGVVTRALTTLFFLYRVAMVLLLLLVEHSHGRCKAKHTLASVQRATGCEWAVCVPTSI